MDACSVFRGVQKIIMLLAYTSEIISGGVFGGFHNFETN